jgi:signal recognition particle subunit SRP54
MFESLGERLTGVFDRLTGRGVLSEKDVDEALREVRLALLDADVALPVVRDFIAKARESATGEAVIRAVKPSEQVVKWSRSSTTVWWTCWAALRPRRWISTSRRPPSS